MQQRQPHAALEQLPDRSALLGDGLLDFGQLPPGGLRPVDAGENVQGGGGKSLFTEPAGTFRHEQQQTEQDHRRHESRQQHPPPHFVHEHYPPDARSVEVGIQPGHLGQAAVRQVRHQHAESDGELVHGDQSAAAPGRRNFGDVQRRKHRGDADARAADQPRRHQVPRHSRHRRSDRTDREQHGREKQDLLAAEAVAQRAGNRRADQAADQCRTDDPSFHPIGQFELRLPPGRWRRRSRPCRSRTTSRPTLPHRRPATGTGDYLGCRASSYFLPLAASNMAMMFCGGTSAKML